MGRLDYYGTHSLTHSLTMKNWVKVWFLMGVNGWVMEGGFSGLMGKGEGLTVEIGWFAPVNGFGF